ncbi:type II 3-dehydroquinate dehydratase, partial [Candidatus Gottesmanbacteria bacterium]|nr:type II 3-dehydroquinate dehydratase [Candidatus Gottesmanbacteria bacterium]
VKYGKTSLHEIKRMLLKQAKKSVCQLEFFQSNHEGAIIDFLQTESAINADGVLINPGALVRYGYSLRQALIDLGKPVVEIHMSDINRTGVNKKVNILDDVRIDQIVGLKVKSYELGLRKLVSYLNKVKF